MRHLTALKNLTAGGARVASSVYMLESVVRYLRSHGVAFRLASYPAPEQLPSVAHTIQVEDSQLLETRVVLVGGQPAIACVPHGAGMNLIRLGFEIDTTVIEGTAQDLQAPHGPISEPVPPLGGLFKVPIFVDESAAKASVIAFCAFSPTDYIELAYDDFARLEQPRIASFAAGGQLPEHGSPPA